MSCAELLAVCLLSADRGPKPHRQPLPIFHDDAALCRYIIILPFYLNADDGKLSFEEFKNYFADGILSSEELWELFSGIDRRHSDNVDTEKLCGKSGDVPALESFPFPGCMWWGLCVSDLGRTGCHRQYETASKMEQFLTRFLLRETMHQLQSLQASLECAVDTVEEQAGRERKEIKKSETLVGLRSGRRCGRRGQKNVCLSPTDPYSGMLTTGTCCPSGCLCPAGAWRGSVLKQGMHPTVLWKPRGEADVQSSAPLSQAAGAHTRAMPGLCQGRASLPSPGSRSLCPHSVSACKLTDEACFILYEFWQDVTSWRSHLQSSCSKTFQQSILSLLESPELLTTMLFPASWWIMNNN
ncbi:NECA1 protein, partial [Falcunculus frontatus]|nr:NECA1 protein [Falcunculus frontatus]